MFALLFGTGMRVGQALGLRHEDFVGHERRVELVPREGNANGGRGKNGRGSIPVTTELVCCYSDYMHEEYGELDSDYVFVNVWGGRVGHPMSYATVDDLVRRTRAAVGFHFTPHMFRHTYASMARAGGVPLEVVSKILTHRSLQTTSAICTHTTAKSCVANSSGPGGCRSWAGEHARAGRSRERAPFLGKRAGWRDPPGVRR